MLKESNGGHEIKRKNEGIDAYVGRTLVEKAHGLPVEVLRRLELDLKMNKTADYSRINLTQVFSMFGCDVKNTITHWRIAKILDGITVAASEYGICKGISPGEIPEKIYQVLADGNGDKENSERWNVRVVNPETGLTEEKGASLADFAYFIDLLEANRSLGTKKMDVRRLIYNHFVLKQNVNFIFETEIVKEKKDDNGVDIVEYEKKKINLADSYSNPRDNYKNIDIKAYEENLDDIDVKGGLQIMESWRFTSEQHRELGGQAEAIQKRGDKLSIYYIPLSGRMAAAITLGDLQKGEGGMKGQPQEMVEMDEEVTGAAIRARLSDIQQRGRGSDPRRTVKNARLSKVMVGLVLSEKPTSQMRKEIDKETKKEKTIIHLCGEELNTSQIVGMKAHYDKKMLATRGFALSKREAADMAFTDVFAPFIINNENDWLTGFADTYGLGTKGGQSVINNKDNFSNFEIRIMCRNWDNPPNHPLEWVTFKSMTGEKGLSSYVAWRVQRGDIDQPGAFSFATKKHEDEVKTEQPQDNEYYFGKSKKTKNGDSEVVVSIDQKQAKTIKSICEHVLGQYAESYVKKFITLGDNRALCSTFIDKDGNFVPNDEIFVGKTALNFSQVVSSALLAKIKTGDNRIQELFISLYDADERQYDSDNEAMVQGLVASLIEMSDTERKKLL